MTFVPWLRRMQRVDSLTIRGSSPSLTCSEGRRGSSGLSPVIVLAGLHPAYVSGT